MKTTEKFVFFYGDEDIYSNFYLCNITVKNITFFCQEQLFMYMKAKHFKDEKTADLILKAKTPFQCKQLGRQVNPFDEAEWNFHSEKYMRIGVYHKFTQHKDLQKELLDTHDKELCEASPRDRLWGVGLSEHNSLILDKKNWLGENRLGKVTMDVRSMIKNELLNTQKETKSKPKAFKP
jgi:ribA/ribD-fused uncharacterized protein